MRHNSADLYTNIESTTYFADPMEYVNEFGVYFRFKPPQLLKMHGNFITPFWNQWKSPPARKYQKMQHSGGDSPLQIFPARRRSAVGFRVEEIRIRSLFWSSTPEQRHIDPGASEPFNSPFRDRKLCIWAKSSWNRVHPDYKHSGGAAMHCVDYKRKREPVQRLVKTKNIKMQLCFSL